MISPRLLESHLLRALCLGLLTIAAGLPGIQGLAIARGDEKFYIQWSHHMFETGNFLVPVHDGDLNLAKPPLYYWLAAASYRLFGLSLFSFRFPSLLAAGASVALVYWFTLRLYGSGRSAVYAALAMASSYTIYFHSRLALTDMLMTLGVLWAGYFYLRGVMRTENRSVGLFLASTGVGIAGMAKGHVGLLVALLPLVFFTALDWKSPGRLRLKELLAPWTWFPALFLSAWWYLFLLLSDRPAIELAPHHPRSDQTLSQAFIDFFRAEELEGRSSGGLRGLLKNLGFYPLAVLRMFFPWSLCVLAGFFFGRRWLLQDWKEKRRETLMLLMMIVPVFLLFTVGIRQQARSRYLLPMAPAVAILAARFLGRRHENQASPARLPLPAIVACGLLLFYNLVFVGLMPAVRGQPAEQLCQELKTRLTPGDQVWLGGMHTKWHTYAMAILARPVVFLGPETPPASLLERIGTLESSGEPAKPKSVYLIVPQETWEALPAACQKKFRVVAEAHGFIDEMEWEEIWEILRGRADSRETCNRRHLLLLKSPYHG